MLAVGLDRFEDLHGQFAGRGENQGTDRVLGWRRAAAGKEGMRCRMGSVKAAVLPVPVWAPPMMSFAANDERNGLGLDRGGFGSLRRALHAAVRRQPRSAKVISAAASAAGG